MKNCPMCGEAWVTYADGTSDCVDHCHGLGKAGKAWSRARQRERDAAAVVYELIRKAHAGGMPETAIAELAGVDRMTVRRALGKL